MTAKNVFVAGHLGMVGRALCRQLDQSEMVNLLTFSRADLDLTNQSEVCQFFNSHDIDEIYLAAAKVGGIFANNTYPADFLYENLMIQSNVINQAHEAGIEKLLFLGSSCIYPRLASQPMSEEALLSGHLEPTNEPYAIAKIAGIKLCESYNRQHGRDFRSVMPTNLYGPWDNFHSDNSHVIPALIKRFHEAKMADLKEVVCWGSGQPRREFLHVDDMASAAIHIMTMSKDSIKEITESQLSHINVGFGNDMTIDALTLLVSKTIGYTGNIVWDTSKPDGAPRKLMCSDKLRSTGWKPRLTIDKGLKATYEWYLSEVMLNDG